MPSIDATKTLVPYWQTSDHNTVRLYQGNSLDVLKQLPDQSVHMVVTSPPYWGLRDYGTSQWIGSNLDCPHQPTKAEVLHKCMRSNNLTPGGVHRSQFENERSRIVASWKICPKCGAKKTDAQIGSEATPQQFVQVMVTLFHEVYRVLHNNGTLWLNLGDTYSSGGNLVGIPWRVALALQADGWILRQDIIWHKPSPMPESVRNRCTKSHEYIFLFVKKMGYFYDAEAIKSPATESHLNRQKSGYHYNDEEGRKSAGANTIIGNREIFTSNKRSVWTVSSQGYSGSHFATYPPKLIEPCIKAGTSEKGCCARCGGPWVRVVEGKKLTRERPNDYVKRTGENGTGNSCANTVAGVDVKTVGWKPTCKCNADVVPCVVLDPFIGSGTTCCVSISLGRNSIGIDLSKQYLDHNAIPRISGELLARPSLAHLVGRKPKRLNLGKKLA